jgi:hypothetical protein
MGLFAPVAPVQILHEMLINDCRGLFGDYHLLLAHHTVEKEESFRRLWRTYERKTGMNRVGATIIMDNSLVELGGAVDDQMVRTAVSAVKFEVGNRSHVIPVLPDVMGDGVATMEASSDGYDRWKDSEMPGDGYMLVAQGKDMQEFYNVIDYFFILHKEFFRDIRWVGIPRKLAQLTGSRKTAIRYVQSVAPQVKIHLLGFCDNILDDIRCARLLGVAGIDSAVPVRHQDVLLPTSEVGPRDPNWFEEGVLTDRGATNVRNFRRWVSSKEYAKYHH